MLFTTTGAYDSITSLGDAELIANINASAIATFNQTDGNQRVSAMLNNFETNNFKELEHDSCVSEYSQLFFTDYGDLILVLNGTIQYEANGAGYDINSTMDYLDAFANSVSCDSNTSIIQNSCITNITNGTNAAWWLAESVASNSTKPGCLKGSNGLCPTDNATMMNITHCLAEIVPKYCKLQMSTPLAVVVIAANAVKIIAMLVTICLKADPVLNIGDAVSSFLQKPEITRAVLNPWKRGISSDSDRAARESLGEHDSLIRLAAINQQTPLRWCDAVSVVRWRTCMFL